MWSLYGISNIFLNPRIQGDTRRFSLLHYCIRIYIRRKNVEKIMYSLLYWNTQHLENDSIFTDDNQLRYFSGKEIHYLIMRCCYCSIQSDLFLFFFVRKIWWDIVLDVNRLIILHQFNFRQLHESNNEKLTLFFKTNSFLGGFHHHPVYLFLTVISPSKMW